MYVKVEVDGNYLISNSWSGAKDTIQTVIEHRLLDELVYLIEELFCDDEDITDVKLNDFLWFDREYIFEQLGIEEEN